MIPSCSADAGEHQQAGAGRWSSRRRRAGGPGRGRRRRGRGGATRRRRRTSWATTRDARRRPARPGGHRRRTAVSAGTRNRSAYGPGRDDRLAAREHGTTTPSGMATVVGRTGRVGPLLGDGGGQHAGRPMRRPAATAACCSSEPSSAISREAGPVRGQRDRGDGAADLDQHPAELDDAEPGAVVLLGEREPEQPGGARPAHRLAVEPVARASTVLSRSLVARSPRMPGGQARRPRPAPG